MVSSKIQLALVRVVLKIHSAVSTDPSDLGRFIYPAHLWFTATNANCIGSFLPALECNFAPSLRFTEASGRWGRGLGWGRNTS